MRRPKTVLIAIVLAVLAAACTSGGDPEDPPSPDGSSTVGAGLDGPRGGPAVSGPADWGVPVTAAGQDATQLVAFDSCDALLDHYVKGASDLVGPYGLGGQGWAVMEGDVAMAATEAVADDAAAGSDGAQSTVAAPAAGEDFSTTNVQEEGVDEPDVVKTDGELIVTASEGNLRIVDVATAEVVGRLDLPDEAWNTELLLSGDDLLVLSSGGAGGGPVPTDNARIPAFPAERVTITRVDLSDPANPAMVGGMRLEGAYRSARMVDGTVRIVMVSQPTGLSFVHPEDGGLSAEQEAEETNRQILAESDLDDWVPHLQVLDAEGNAGEVQRVLDCSSVARPDEFSGFSTMSVLTMDIGDDSMEPSSAAGVVAAGDTVYASTDRLVVATSPWGRWFVPFVEEDGRTPDDDELVTDLHSFDISDPSTTRYVDSASVNGTLLNQFALSEIDGVLRVATTTQPDWWGRSNEVSQSSLVVFREQDEELVETGRVDGLGKTERIYAVRYLGPDLAAIVTFRETDPLYLVDTSDPAAPQVTGELKIPGFSSYLHPVGEGQLVGIGQDADERGRTQGLQASLFDISDLASPERVDQVVMGEGYSPVEQDHRAFLHWAPTGQVVLPAELWEDMDWAEFEEECAEGGDCIEPKPFIGAVVLELDGATVQEQGRVSLADDGDRDWWGQVQRSIVIGDHLWLVAHDRLARFDLSGLDDRAIVPLG